MATDNKKVVKTNANKPAAFEGIKEATKETAKEVANAAKGVASAAKETVTTAKAETKAVVAPKVEETKAAVEEKKEAVKAVAAAKTVKDKKPSRAAKKAAAKDEVKTEVFVQYQGNEAVIAEVIEKAKGEFAAAGHRVGAIKSLQVYLKPEEFAAYYVINQKFAGRVNLF